MQVKNSQQGRVCANEEKSERSRPPGHRVESKVDSFMQISGFQCSRNKGLSISSILRGLGAGLMLGAGGAYAQNFGYGWPSNGGSAAVQVMPDLCPPNYRLDRYPGYIQELRIPREYRAVILFVGLGKKDCEESADDIQKREHLETATLRCSAEASRHAQTNLGPRSFGSCLDDAQYTGECVFGDVNLYPKYRVTQYFCTPEECETPQG